MNSLSRLRLPRLSQLSLLGLALATPLGLAACGDDGDGSAQADADNAGPIDAAPVDANNIPQVDAEPPGADATPSALACAGKPLPTTVAAPPVSISGEVQSAGLTGAGPNADPADVSAHQRSDDSLITEGTFTGAFSLEGPNSSDPVDAYVKSVSAGKIDTYVYPPAPLTEDYSDVPIIMLDEVVWGVIPVLTGADQSDANGAIIAALLDCNSDEVEGAVVSITPQAGTLRYAEANGIPGMTNYSATQSSGIAYFINVPPGEYTVSAEKDGVNLRSVVVKTYAKSATTLIVAP